MDTKKIETEASANWGLFRKWLSAHPLTGFWGAAVVFGAVGYLIGIA